MIKIDFSTQIAVITGASKGIGLGITKAFIQSGAKVAMIDIDAKSLQSAAFEINSQMSDTKAFAFVSDISNYNQVELTAKEIYSKVGEPCILVNNAGISSSAPLFDVKVEDWERSIAVNLSGAFYCAQIFAKHMVNNKYGRIINIASTGGKIGWPRNHAYCSSKSGLIGLTRVLALDLAPHAITVNAICPGNTNTDMMTLVDEDISRYDGLKIGQFIEEQIQRIPLRKLAEPEDIAWLSLFLCSQYSSHITGQAINVDGGTVMY